MAVQFIRSDLEFILAQILYAEQGGQNGENLLNILPNVQVPWGLRTVDGSYNNLVFNENAGIDQTQFGAADTVFWFDLPTRTCMTGILTRIATSHGRVRPEMAAGCPEKIDFAFWRYVWTYRRLRRPRMLEYLERLRPDQSLICFTNRTQADQYLAEVAPAGAEPAY